MLSNLVTESTTEQSIKVSGEMGPQIKQYTHHLFQMPRSSLYILMSKTAPPLVPVQKTEPSLLKENGAPGAVQEHACVRQRRSFLPRLLSSAARSKPSALAAVRVTVGPRNLMCQQNVN